MFRPLSRVDKEARCRSKMVELDARWGNPPESDWEFLKKLSDTELDTALADTIGNLRSAKGWIGWRIVKWTAVALLFLFVGLGLLGLLLFGIRQLLGVVGL